MHRLLSLLFVVAVCTIGAFSFTTGKPSGTPMCYACPPKDHKGYKLCDSDLGKDPFFCSYPRHPEDDPTDNSCFYAKNGSLVHYFDDDHCVSVAVDTCASKRRDALPRSPRAGHNARAPMPAHMQERSKLKKRRG